MQADRGRRYRPLTLLLAGVMFLLVLIQTSYFSRQQALAELQQRAEADLARYALSVQQKLDRYKDLPRLLATHSSLHEALTTRDPDRIQRTNEYLQQVNETIGAADIYLMNASGTTRAASNWYKSSSFVGLNFSFRPYFQQARAGRAGRYFALGTTSRQRGYYFSWPVMDEAQVIGVVVVKIDLHDIEQDWNDPLQDLAVTDEDGIIVISTRPEWKFHALEALAPADLKRVVDSMRYLDRPLSSLQLMRSEILNEQARLITLQEGGVSERSVRQQYLQLQRPVPETGLRVLVMARLQPVSDAVLQASILAGCACLAALLLVLFIQARWRIVRERREYVQQLQGARDALETRVAERTADLSRTNARLLDEMAQHRSTQNELIQTAKLAVLGQLAAGINHELNQPLTAIRNYADNAAAFLRLGKAPRAEVNLQEIAGLTERMAKIIHPLKEFSRQSSGQPVPTSLKEVCDGAMSIMYGRLDQQGVQLEWPEQLEQVFVLGDTLRLEQVLVNLLSNALQAMENSPRKCIEVSLTQSDGWVQLSLHDTGPGIATDDLQRVFEPFYTTKEQGHGLGLGLSISHRIMDNLGGRLTAANHSEGGAVFTLSLPVPRSVQGPPEQRVCQSGAHDV
ncbi:ATP-binding protein [Marinobacterium marinum]|uniref:C4-dicarboxylate transport sensor protein DctB n=1 Tax=Marinobacterium marinum TaxID=2756129 RepID=A0A7W1WX31_9GAMM|nr:ATP-binding protein [Marinobacterium marinum]MBA4501651.1 sensor histidine kinase [Marinobacterium marinum]